jgi:hypothetical protein
MRLAARHILLHIAVLTGIVTVSAVVVVSMPVSATSFTSEALFQAAAGAFVLEDFEGIAAGTQVTQIVGLGVSFDPLDDDVTFPSVQLRSNTGGSAQSGVNIFLNDIDFALPGRGPMNFRPLNVGDVITAVGYWNTGGDDSTTLTFFDADGVLIETVSSLSGHNFVGIVNLAGASRVEIAPLAGNGYFTIDDLQATTVTRIPLCFVIDSIDDQFSVINDGTPRDFPVLENDECDDDVPICVVPKPDDLLPDRGGSATTDGCAVSYTPAAGFVGFEHFTYTAQDAGLQGDPPAVDQDTATVVVEVLEDIIPDAVEDLATTLQNQATIIDVLANDTLGNAPNGVGIETAPANGSATVQANDTIRYSPNFGFFGEDSFEYRLTDANGDSDVATVTVGVFFVSGPQVPIDIMPNSDGNNLNLRAGQGAGIDIAILSVGEFFEAPNLIDPLTLKFGPREANIWGSPQVRDVDGDGDDDLVVKFLIQQTGIPCGDTHANLFGRTFDFQPISGMDTINTFNCPRIRKRH